MTSVNTRARALPPQRTQAESNTDASVALLSAQHERPPLASFKAPMAERFAFSQANLYGRHVKLQRTDGRLYEGILGPLNPDPDQGDVTLFCVREVLHLDEIMPMPLKELTFRGAEVAQIVCSNANLLVRDAAEAKRNMGEVIADTEIEGDRTQLGVERTLVKADWLIGDARADGALEAGGKGRRLPTKWDQFAENERIAGKSEYHEELYTTKLQTQSYSKEQMEAAERLAREIETSTSDNVHVAEERGQASAADALDEEERYSTVLRSDAVSQPAPPTAPVPAAPPAAPAAPPAAPADKPAAVSKSKLNPTAKSFTPTFGGGGGGGSGFGGDYAPAPVSVQPSMGHYPGMAMGHPGMMAQPMMMSPTGQPMMAGPSGAPMMGGHAMMQQQMMMAPHYGMVHPGMAPSSMHWGAASPQQQQQVHGGYGTGPAGPDYASGMPPHQR